MSVGPVQPGRAGPARSRRLPAHRRVLSGTGPGHGLRLLRYWSRASAGCGATASTGEHPPPADAAHDPPASGWTGNYPVRHLLGILSPGLVTGAADDDPSGIATYSTDPGGQFGYGQPWTAVWMLPLVSAVQEVRGRIGNITGQGPDGHLHRSDPGAGDSGWPPQGRQAAFATGGMACPPVAGCG
jgi:hypothetical protein